VIAVLLLAGAFAVGSIPFGVLVARRRGVDIKAHGSGNIGATNVARVLGPLAGLIVLALDAIKGALPVLCAREVGASPWLIVATGFAAIAGHCFSPILGGKGGKGVATATGVFAVLAPELVPFAILVFVVVLWRWRVPALGSLAGVALVAAVLVVRGDLPTAALACTTLALLVYTHRKNLGALRVR
jgi:acyl phosphate:glycerol-3-phosphate acyltransferase